MFRPNLAGKVEDVSQLKFPILASQKLDGIRCLVQGGELVSRNLKSIANAGIQKTFAGLPSGLDGELLYGNTFAPDCFRKTSSSVMSHGGDCDDIVYHVFDFYGPEEFADRLQHAAEAVKIYGRKMPIRLVEHVQIETPDDLLQMEADMLARGAEGLMVRSLEGKYKEGRSTWREQTLLKLKRFEDSDATIIGVTELFRNLNEKTTNALGRSERSSHQENKVAAGTLGNLIVVDLTTGVEFEIGTGFDDETRSELWKARKKIIGQTVKYKFFPGGVKDKPRFPVYLGMLPDAAGEIA